MHNSVKISCVIPVHNAEKSLKSTLESLCNQTYQEFEVILVDDASDDASLRIMEEFRTIDDRIHVMHLYDNVGAARARNIGLKKAKGKFVIFLDADDFFYPKMLEKAYIAVSKESADMAVFSYEQCEQRETEGDNIVSTRLVENNLILETEINELDFRRAAHVPWNKLVTKELLEHYQIEFQDIPTNNDTFYSIASLMCAKKIVMIEDILIRYNYDRNGSLTQKRKKKDYVLQAYEEILRFAEKVDILEYKKNIVYIYVVKEIRKYFGGNEYNTEIKRERLETFRKRDVMDILCKFMTTEYCSDTLKKFIKLLVGETSAEQLAELCTRENLLKNWIIMEHNERRRVAIWGCGRLGTRWILSLQGTGEQFDYIIDSKPELHGKDIGNNIVQTYDEVQDEVDSILLMVPSKKAETEIRAMTVGKRIVTEDDLWSNM